MTSKKLKVAIGSALISGFASLFAPLAHADEATLEILEILRSNGDITEEKYQALKDKVAEEDGNTIVDADGGLSFATEDGDFEWEFGGRLQFDTAFYDADDSDAFENGAEIRRARLGMEGLLWNVWGFEVQFDLTGESNAELKDAYINYQGFEDTILQVGHFKQPFGMEELTSSKYDWVMHQSTVTETFVPGRALGVGVYHVLNDMFTVAGGIFSDEFGEEDAADGSPWGATGRLTFSPIHEEGRALHLAVAGSFQTPNQADELDYSSSFETHINDTDLVDTGALGPVDDYTLLGLEAAGVYDRFSGQAEYIRTDISRGAGLDDLSFDGWYVMASVFLTDDTRPYDFEEGEFNKVSPNSIVGKGGYGAWELVGRYSNLNLNDGPIQGGELDTFTAALNWYATKHIRFGLNYNAVLDNANQNSSIAANLVGVEPAAIEARAYVFW